MSEQTMTLIPKKKNKETFRVIGLVRDDKTIEQIAVEVEVLASDLLRAAYNKRSCASNAETIMHLCADILAISKNQ
jgi:hypothetical protein